MILWLENKHDLILWFVSHSKNYRDKSPIFRLDYDTDEETDKLLGVEHRINAKNQAVRDAVRFIYLNLFYIYLFDQ